MLIKQDDRYFQQFELTLLGLDIWGRDLQEGHKHRLDGPHSLHKDIYHWKMVFRKVGYKHQPRPLHQHMLGLNLQMFLLILPIIQIPLSIMTSKEMFH